MARLQSLLVLALFGLCAAQASAQSVVTNALSVSGVCLRDSLTVSYTASGSFAAKNAFTVQLSAPDGSFDGGFTSLGSIRSTTSGSIRVWIAPTIATGNAYRVRVSSSTPYVVGPDNGSNLSISGPADVGFSVVPNQRVLLEGGSATFSAWDLNSGDTHTWTFSNGTSNWTMTGQVVSPTFATAGAYSLRHEVTNAAGCVSVWDSSLSWPVQPAPIVHVYSCMPQIPDTVRIDSVESGFASSRDSGSFGAIWVVPGGTLEINRYDIHVVYAEAGSIVRYISGGPIVVYLKDGASYEGSGSGYEVLVYSSGAGLTKVGPYSPKLLCPNLNFDYSVAPPYKIKPASVATSDMTSGIELRPNPASRTLHVSLPEAPDRIRVSTLTGTELLSFDHALGRTMDLGVGTLPNGVYYLQIETHGHLITTSFVISR